MKKIFLALIKTYAILLGIFILQKPLFMLYHLSLYKTIGLSEWFRVMIKGLPLDLSMGGYFMLIPMLLSLVALWVKGGWYGKVLKWYLYIISGVISVIFISDIELYTYWGFRLDTTPFFYLQSPTNAIASVPMDKRIILPLLMVAYGFINCLLFKRVVIRPLGSSVEVSHRLIFTPVMLILTGSLFIPIRGGFTVSTMNVGKVYFSDNILLNHAAINPSFNLMESMSRRKDFKSQYRFMEEEKAGELFVKMVDKGADVNPGCPVGGRQMLSSQRPNVIMIVLESFSGVVTEYLGGEKGVTPNLDKLAKEGIAFTNFYANSFRTDRGLVSLLSGYPAQPTNSIMKYPKKTQSLPSISQTLKREGYDMTFLYGGDADFTNMRSYFVSSGFARVVSDQNFPISDKLTKWGVRDDKTFEYFAKDIENQTEFPFMKLFLTLSSHEPFDVPTCKFDQPYLNSVAYTDSCLGLFIDKLKQMPVWDNTLVILVPDHCALFPQGMTNHESARYHIPMVWTGGAVKEAQKVTEFGSQIDLSATLLAQLGLSHDDFTFSKNMLNPGNNRFGYYTFINGFGILNDSSCFIYDCESNKPLFTIGIGNNDLEESGKAYLQMLYNDLDAR